MPKAFNLADLFELVADAVPERQALVCGDSRASFGQLESRANRLAHHLASQGVGAGDHVGLYLYNCNEYVESMLACWKLRAVPVNVNYRYVAEELTHIFENAQLVATVHHREFAPLLKELDAPLLRTLVTVDDGSGVDFDGAEYEAALAQASDVRDFGERSDDDLFLLYTGGTTGLPKGVMWPHRALFFAALGGGGWFHPDGPITEPEQIAGRIGETPIVGMALAPLMHGACWWYTCIQMLGGNCVVLSPHRSLVGEQVWDIAEQEKVNSMTIVGDAMAAPLLEALDNNPGRWDLSAIFNIGSGGAVFSVSKQEAFKQHFPNCFITNSFGSSEGGAMGFDSGEKKGEDKGLGNVAKSDYMDVIGQAEDGSHYHVAAGETGMFARSGHIPIGYYNAPEKTAETFVPVDGTTWLLTGDEARLEEDGSITVFGRGSNCINSGGEKIFPEEVEEALKSHDAIYDCLVVDVPDERFGSRVSAVVALRDGHTITLDDLQEEARKHIAGYKLPRELHLVDEIPRAPSGKPVYPEARKMALSGDFLAS